jgi:hypothetical protein
METRERCYVTKQYFEDRSRLKNSIDMFNAKYCVCETNNSVKLGEINTLIEECFRKLETASSQQ